MANLVQIAFGMATPLILAGMAGWASERSGVINIALEGKMLFAACTVAIVGAHQSPAVAILAGILVSTIMSMLHWLATQKYAVDHVVSGMAINAIAAGGTNFLYSRMGDPDRSGGVVLLPTISFQILAICITIALAFWVSRTRGGIHITAVGADPEKARLAGLQPLTVRLQALLATGALTGLAGVYLVADTGVFSDNMTAGRGYIALAALILGGWRVVPTALACLAFGILSSVNLVLQGTKMGDFQLPSEFWTSLPYLATIVALAGFLGKQRTPQGLGKT